MNWVQQKKLVLGLAGATIIGMPALAWIISGWSGVIMQERLLLGAPIWIQLVVGAAGGLSIGLFAQWFVERSFMRQVTSRYLEMIAPLNLTNSEVFFVALCAGVGEEVLFRGAIQPIIGIWPTAVIFIALHGYLSFKHWRISLYGLIMTGMMALLGYATEMLGIWTAIVAHTVIDVYLLKQMKLPDHLNWKTDHGSGG